MMLEFIVPINTIKCYGNSKGGRDYIQLAREDSQPLIIFSKVPLPALSASSLSFGEQKILSVLLENALSSRYLVLCSKTSFAHSSL